MLEMRPNVPEWRQELLGCRQLCPDGATNPPAAEPKWTYLSEGPPSSTVPEPLPRS